MRHLTPFSKNTNTTVWSGNGFIHHGHKRMPSSTIGATKALRAGKRNVPCPFRASPDMNTTPTPLSLDQVADHLERLLLRYEELQRSNALLQAQLQEVLQERDALRSRLTAARTRMDALLARLPAAETPPAATHAAAMPASGAAAAPHMPQTATGARASASHSVRTPSTSLLATFAAPTPKSEPDATTTPSAWGEDNT